jgi:hypothetical protein
MSAIKLRLFDADRMPLDDIVDVDIVEAPTLTLRATRRNVAGASPLSFANLQSATVYRIEVFPLRHRPVGSLCVTSAKPVDLFTPLHPDRVIEVRFRTFAALEKPLRDVLDRSLLEPHNDQGNPTPVPPPGRGDALYDGLERERKAGLLNLFTKLSNTPLGRTNAWAFVNDLYRIRGDRIFANVAPDFRDAVRNAEAIGLFERVPGALHTPPLGFADAGSFKTTERHGVLQVTFFVSTIPPMTFKADLDIDDAGGVGHVFQVLRNFFTDSPTHPYDIHQLLTFHQRTRPPYDLLA